MTRANLPVDGQKCCTLCKQTLPVGDFLVDRHTKSGLTSWCKTCHRKAARERYYRDHAKTLEKQRARQSGPEFMAKATKRVAASNARHPEKKAARKKFNLAVRDGKIQRQPCHKCGAAEAHGHHHDYSKPFDVEWLCSVCHGREHRWSPEGLEHLRRTA